MRVLPFFIAGVAERGRSITAGDEQLDVPLQQPDDRSFVISIEGALWFSFEDEFAADVFFVTIISTLYIFLVQVPERGFPQRNKFRRMGIFYPSEKFT